MEDQTVPMRKEAASAGFYARHQPVVKGASGQPLTRKLQGGFMGLKKVQSQLSFACLGALWLTCCLGVVNGTSQLPERFVAYATDLRAAPASSPTNLIEIVIERWSTAAEQDGLVSGLRDTGQKGLLTALTRIQTRAGYLRYLDPGSAPAPGEVRTPFVLKYAQEAPDINGGRRILMIEESLSPIEIRLRSDGEGNGRIWPPGTNRFVVGKDKTTLELEGNGRESIALTIRKR
jgi:hypothetical protein